MPKIIQLVTDWLYTLDGDGYDTYDVGKHDVVEIKEHPPQGEGDRWFYDVIYEDGRMKRLFNPNSVSFAKPDEE